MDGQKKNKNYLTYRTDALEDDTLVRRTSSIIKKKDYLPFLIPNTTLLFA